MDKGGRRGGEGGRGGGEGIQEDKEKKKRKIKENYRDFSGCPEVRTYASTSGVMASVPHRGTKTLQVCGVANKKKSYDVSLIKQAVDDVKVLF